MVAVIFRPAGGRTAIPAGHEAGKILMNNLATTPVLGGRVLLQPYQAVVLELERD
jgi:hypothetical protein